MNTVNKLDELSLEDIRRLERNSHFYHEYRHAVENVFRMLQENATVTVPFEFAVALGRLRDIHIEAKEVTDDV